MRSRLRALRDDDSGAMLIVALLIITSVAVVTGALLTHGSTNFRATVALEGVAGTSYAGDAAAKVAVNNLRLGAKAPGWVTPTFPGLWTDWVYTDNADGTGCFGAEGTLPKDSLELKNLYPKAGDQTADSSARVECSVVPGTGIFGAGSGVGIRTPIPTDSFARALTTVGTTGPWQGMLLKPLGTGNAASMPVRGGIASKSFITVDNGALVTDGYVKAEGACTGVVVSNPSKACNQPGSVPTPATPPSPLSSVPTYRYPSAYAATCVFQPGFYNNGKTLSDAVNGCTTARFASGKYYFDFRDEERGTGQNVWNITKTVIGGEYVGGSIPGSCKSPILNDPVTGVQFVFGGTSRMTVSDTARVELCGPSNAGEPPLTLFQEQSGSTSAAVPLTAQPAQTVTQGTGPKVDPVHRRRRWDGRGRARCRRGQQPQVGREQQQQRSRARREQLLGAERDPGRVGHHLGAGPDQVHEVGRCAKPHHRRDGDHACDDGACGRRHGLGLGRPEGPAPRRSSAAARSTPLVPSWRCDCPGRRRTRR